MILLNIFIATVAISLISLVSIFFVSLNQKFLDKVVFVLIALSIGAMLGGAFFHLIPEALEMQPLSQNIFLFVLAGFFSFFIVEKIFHWRHCHDEKCKVHSFAYTNLFGDAVHNFIDGLLISASFFSGNIVGLATTFAIAIHEIPQELGDFGVLIFAGFSKKKALLYNFLIALTAIAGGILGYFFLNSFRTLTPFLLSFAAGGFVYIAASDLLPEIKKIESARQTLINFAMIVVGLSLIYFLGIILGE